MNCNDFTANSKRLTQTGRCDRKSEQNENHVHVFVSSGTLSKDEFLSIKELQGNPLLERVIDVFDENQDGEVQFTEFISSLAVFSQNGNDDAKLRCKIRDHRSLLTSLTRVSLFAY